MSACSRHIVEEWKLAETIRNKKKSFVIKYIMQSLQKFN